MLEHVFVCEDPPHPSGGHHALPELSKATHEEEIVQRLPEHVAAREALFFRDPIELAPNRLREADRDGIPHVLDSNKARGVRSQL